MVRKFVVALLFVGPTAVGVAPAAIADAPYKNCTEARANGDTNIPSSSDKYQPKLDRDGDGVGCES